MQILLGPFDSVFCLFFTAVYFSQFFTEFGEVGVHVDVESLGDSVCHFGNELCLHGGITCFDSLYSLFEFEKRYI